MILGVWHCDLPAASSLFRKESVATMVSASRDGSLLVELLTSFGFWIVRGSSSRGTSTLRHLAQRPERILAMALDGPKGPAMHAKPGTFWLCHHTNRPLWVPTFEYGLHFRLNSWDQMVIPLPFSRIRVHWSHNPNPPMPDPQSTPDWVDTLNLAPSTARD